MDGPTIGILIAVIGGVVLTAIGCLIGAHFGIKRANGPRELALANRVAVVGWVGVSAYLACLFLVPMPWRFLIWGFFIPAFFWFVRWALERQALAQAEDRDQAGVE